MQADYAERLWWGNAEPINTLSNAAFIFAAWAITRKLHRENRPIAPLLALIGLACTVGLGSGLWHAWPTPVTKLMDLIPILLFQLVFLWQYLRQRIALPRWQTAVAVALYATVNYFMLQVPPYFNGSILYLPTIVVLFGLGTYHFFSLQPQPELLFQATLVFCVALFFRTVDMWVIGVFPIGTHFLWHTLNGLLLYLAMVSVIPRSSSELALRQA